jgi:hypothetical protein
MRPAERPRRRVYRTRAIARRRRSVLALAALVVLTAALVASGTSGGRDRVKYDRAAAAAYADRWALTTNPAYWSSPDSDCANFVSQCARAGGLRPLRAPGGGWHANGIEFPSVAWVNVGGQMAAWSTRSDGASKPYIAGASRRLPKDWAAGDVVYLGNIVDGGPEWQHVIICVGRAGGDWVYDSHTVAYRHQPLSVWYPAHFSLIRYCHLTGAVAYD